jgi:hypothetical protein
MFDDGRFRALRGRSVAKVPFERDARRGGHVLDVALSRQATANPPCTAPIARGLQFMPKRFAVIFVVLNFENGCWCDEAMLTLSKLFLHFRAI